MSDVNQLPSRKPRSRKAAASAAAPAADTAAVTAAADAVPDAVPDAAAADAVPATDAAPAAADVAALADMSMSFVGQHALMAVSANNTNGRTIAAALRQLMKAGKTLSAENDKLVAANKKLRSAIDAAKTTTTTDGAAKKSKRKTAAASSDAEVAKTKANVGGLVTISPELAAFLGISDPQTVRSRTEVNSLVHAKAKEVGAAGHPPKLVNGEVVHKEDGSVVTDGRYFNLDSPIAEFFGGADAITAKLNEISAARGKPVQPFGFFSFNYFLKDKHIFNVAKTA